MKKLIIYITAFLLVLQLKAQSFDITVSAGDSIKRITVTTIKKVIPGIPPPIDTTTPPPPPGYSLIFFSGFNSDNDIDPDDHGQKGSGFIDLVNFKDGPGSFHSRPAQVSGGVRSEVQYDDNRTPNEGAIEYDVLYKYVAPGNCHSFQFHPGNSTGSALLALWHNNGKFDVTYNNGGSNFHQSGTLQTILTNVWYHMKIEYKFGAPGYFRWYINGSATPYRSYTGTLKNGTSQYLKLGFNGGFIPNDETEAKKSDILYDNLKIYKK